MGERGAQYALLGAQVRLQRLARKLVVQANDAADDARRQELRAYAIGVRMAEDELDAALRALIEAEKAKACVCNGAEADSPLDACAHPKAVMP